MKNFARNNGLIALACFSALLVGCSLLAKLSEGVSALEDMQMADNYDPSEQYYIGRGVSAVIVDKFKPIEAKDKRNERQITYVNEMAGYIEATSKGVPRSARRLNEHIKDEKDRNSRSSDAQERVYNLSLFKGFQVGLLDTDEVTAFATPGGFLWISRGAVDMCQNEDELAAIVAHELAHIVLDHGMENYRVAHKGKIVSGTLGGWFKGSGLGANFGRMVTSMAEEAFKGYNPEQEYEADAWGTYALAAAGYAPEAMVGMLNRVEAHQKEHKIDEDDYLHHHPPVTRRIQYVKDLIAKEKLKPSSKTMSGEAVQARNKRFSDTFK